MDALMIVALVLVGLCIVEVITLDILNFIRKRRNKKNKE